jgi:hypothetical protein
MSEINLLFDFTDLNAAELAAPAIEECLGRVEMVDQVQAEPQRMRMTGLEIAAAVAVTATVVRSGADAVENLGKLVAAIRALMVQVRALKNVYVDIGEQRVPIDQLDAAKLKELAGN